MLLFPVLIDIRFFSVNDKWHTLHVVIYLYEWESTFSFLNLSRNAKYRNNEKVFNSLITYNDALVNSTIGTVDE